MFANIYVHLFGLYLLYLLKLSVEENRLSIYVQYVLLEVDKSRHKPGKYVPLKIDS